MVLSSPWTAVFVFATHQVALMALAATENAPIMDNARMELACATLAGGEVVASARDALVLALIVQTMELVTLLFKLVLVILAGSVLVVKFHIALVLIVLIAVSAMAVSILLYAAIVPEAGWAPLANYRA
jgi:hypothetical protein